MINEPYPSSFEPTSTLTPTPTQIVLIQDLALKHAIAYHIGVRSTTPDRYSEPARADKVIETAKMFYVYLCNPNIPT